jgi:hypothetical protein
MQAASTVASSSGGENVLFALAALGQACTTLCPLMAEDQCPFVLVPTEEAVGVFRCPFRRLTTFWRFSLEVIVLPCMGLILEILRRPPPDRRHLMRHLLENDMRGSRSSLAARIRCRLPSLPPIPGVARRHRGVSRLGKIALLVPRNRRLSNGVHVA